MTTFRMGALAALALAATTLVSSPALASAAPASDGEVYSRTFDLEPFGGFSFQCSDNAGGAYPYLVFDKVGLGNITYFTGDGTPFGSRPGDLAFWIQDGPIWSAVTGVNFLANGLHKSVTFFCANTLQAAHQRN